jgi:hypothetical protein
MNTPNIYIHDYSLSWLGTDTSMKSGRVNLVLWSQTSSLSKMMQQNLYRQNDTDDILYR